MIVNSNIFMNRRFVQFIRFSSLSPPTTLIEKFAIGCTVHFVTSASSYLSRSFSLSPLPFSRVSPFFLRIYAPMNCIARKQGFLVSNSINSPPIGGVP